MSDRRLYSVQLRTEDIGEIAISPRRIPTKPETPPKLSFVSLHRNPRITDFQTNNEVFWHQFGWADTIGGTGEDWVFDISVDSLGNISIVGSFYASMDFDPNTGTYERSATGSGRAGYLARYRRS